MKALYNFEDISIQVNTQNDTLIHYINEYCYLTPAEAAGGGNILLNYREESPTEFNGVNMVPPDASLDLQALFNMEGVSNIKCFSKGDLETWHIYEGYASIYVNFETKEITSVLNQGAADLNVQNFLLLFIQPLSRMLGAFGYCRLHAACLKVGERHIIITGISGRGKSTAAFALFKRGHQILTDEMPLFKQVADGIEVYALFNMIKLRRSSVDKFFSGFVPIHFQVAEDCYIKLSDLQQAELKKLNKIDDLFVLEQTGKTATSIEPASCLEIAPEMFPSSLNVFNQQRSKTDFQALMELLDTVECYKVFFGTDLEQFAKQVENLARTGPIGKEETA